MEIKYTSVVFTSVCGPIYRLQYSHTNDNFHLTKRPYLKLDSLLSLSRSIQFYFHSFRNIFPCFLPFFCVCCIASACSQLHTNKLGIKSYSYLKLHIRMHLILFIYTTANYYNVGKEFYGVACNANVKMREIKFVK